MESDHIIQQVSENTKKKTPIIQSSACAINDQSLCDLKSLISMSTAVFDMFNVKLQIFEEKSLNEAVHELQCKVFECVL